AAHGWATTVRAYAPGSLTELISPTEAAWSPLADVLHQAGLTTARIGYESGSAYEGSSYAAMHLFGDAIAGLLGAAAPGATLVPAPHALAHLLHYREHEDESQGRKGMRSGNESGAGRR